MGRRVGIPRVLGLGLPAGAQAMLARLSALVLLAGLLVTGCGGGDGSGEHQANATTGTLTLNQEPAHCHLELEADGAASAYTGGGGTTSLQTQLKNTGDGFCTPNSILHLVLRGSDGGAVPVNGNPAAVPIKRQINAGDVLTAEWIWAGWCGSTEQFSVSARFGELRASDPHVPRPLCTPPLPTYTSGFSHFKVGHGYLP